MSVQIDSQGRRFVEVGVRVPGTTGSVWDAIASGPGVSAWFVPTEIDAGPDGIPTGAVSHFGEGMDAVATVTGWEPPQHFSAVSDDFAPGGPPVTTDWAVEPVGDGVCIVRVRHSLATDADEWDAYLESVEDGWPAFFGTLQIYLTDFPGQPSALVALAAMTDDLTSGWRRLAADLGLAGALVGERRASSPGSVELAGMVDRVPSDSELTLRIDAPGPGVAHLFALQLEEGALLSVRLYLYGDDAAATAAAIEPLWQSWMRSHDVAARGA